jgi:hypothetical protein
MLCGFRTHGGAESIGLADDRADFENKNSRRATAVRCEGGAEEEEVVVADMADDDCPSSLRRGNFSNEPVSDIPAFTSAGSS